MASFPSWWGKVAICEQFGWTEEEFLKQNSIGFIRQISAMNDVREKVRREEELKAEAKSRGRGGR